MGNFSPLASAIAIEFECVECGSVLSETIENLPIANILADNVSDSENSEEEIIVCPDCDNEYTCSIYVNQYEGNVEITTDSGESVDGITVETIFNED